MVYCGKASQGCKNCRTRRIKCDKVKPECSQCIRVAKKCPGYRDQLSLMFRDESTKVIQKAHAQWGVRPGEGQAGPSSSSSPTSLDIFVTSPSTFSPPQSSVPPMKDGSPAGASLGTAKSSPPEGALSVAMVKAVGPTATERGVQFYIDRYLLGHPDEPKTIADLGEKDWLFHPSLQTIMAAIGLSGRSNLNGDKEMKTAARQQYVLALQNTAEAIANPKGLRMDVTMRTVVMLAMFELVSGSHESAISAKAHVMGAAALMRSFIPVPQAPAGGFRALIQLCYSMFIPCLTAGTTLPQAYFDWVAMGSESMPEYERPATDLLPIITRFVHLSAYIRGHVFADGQSKTDSVVRQALDIDLELGKWESSATGKWLFNVHEDKMPLDACFHSQYHVYSDMWCARVWSHYRWARILMNQLMLELVERYPMSCLALVSTAQRDRCLVTIKRLAEDVLVSIPTHWKHPRLTAAQRDTMETVGGAGAGSAGIPATLFHLKVAACAPSVPHEFWQWSLDVLETVWADMGMLQAHSLADVVRNHQDVLQRVGAEGILKREPL